MAQAIVHVVDTTDESNPSEYDVLTEFGSDDEKFDRVEYTTETTGRGKTRRTQRVHTSYNGDQIVTRHVDGELQEEAEASDDEGELTEPEE